MPDYGRKYFYNFEYLYTSQNNLLNRNNDHISERKTT